MTRDCRKVEVDPSVQLYIGSVLIAPIGGTYARRSCDAQNRDNFQHVL